MLTNHYAGFAGIAHPHFELDMYLPVPTKLNLGSGIATKKLILSARLESRWNEVITLTLPAGSS